MMNGEVLTDGWKSEAVKDALDLCLACKGCKGDCPVNVDMATYKAEFLSHYYEGRLRPRHAYSMGWIYWWARLASLAPDVANFFSQTPGLSAVAKWLGGIDPAAADAAVRPRDVQGLVPPAGRRATRASRRSSSGPTRSTTTSTPKSAKAAVEVLEAAGLPGVGAGGVALLRPAAVRLRHAGRGQGDCCAQILDTLRPQIQAGIPVVGLEPSCMAVFRDELTNLFPNDEDAKRLQQAVVPAQRVPEQRR